jgi:hypothetical protein
MNGVAYLQVRVLTDSPNQKSTELLNRNLNSAKAESFGETLLLKSLKDVPLEVRRKEAKKPLFLERYE